MIYNLVSFFFSVSLLLSSFLSSLFIYSLYSLLGINHDCFNGKKESCHVLKISIYIFSFRLNSFVSFHLC